MKVLIMTDLEGVSGIVDWDKHASCTPEERVYQQFLMTSDVNGAVEGVLRGGATEVWVCDGHGGGDGNLSAVDIRQLHPAARLYKGVGGVTPAAIGLRPGRWDILMFIGNHAMAGTERGVLCHTFNRGVVNMYLNDLKVGEFGVWAAMAGEAGLSTVMVSGDEMACKQALELIPEIETAPVKEGMDRQRCWCLTPQTARKLIALKAETAVRKIHQIKPFVVKGPVRFREEMVNGTVRDIQAVSVTEAFEIRCSSNALIIK